MRTTRFFAFTLSLLLAAPCLADGMEYDELPMDARIKQVRYDKNDIYTLYTRIGYQTNIELGQGEEVETISVGDRSFWQIIPTGNRIFVRPMQDDVSTNMTVITNRRSYQFDLKSGGAKDKRVVYVLRFNYPDEVRRAPTLAEDPFAVARMAASTPPVQAVPVQPVQTAPAPVQLSRAPAPVAVTVPVQTAPANTRNYLYTFSGAESEAPHEVFDDGYSTYLRYLDASRPLPQVYAVEGGREEKLPVAREGDYVVVQAVRPQLLLRGASNVYVYNEMLSPAP